MINAENAETRRTREKTIRAPVARMECSVIRENEVTILNEVASLVGVSEPISFPSNIRFIPQYIRSAHEYVKGNKTISDYAARSIRATGA